MLNPCKKIHGVDKKNTKHVNGPTNTIDKGGSSIKKR
jgi:hypothetical protein